MPLNIDPFNPVVPPAPLAPPVMTAQRVINDYYAAAKAKKSAYLKVQANIWSGGEERGMLILTAIEKLQPGLTADMQTSAILEKSVMNFVSPSDGPAIVDTVPEAVIVLPDNPKYEAVLALLAG